MDKRPSGHWPMSRRAFVHRDPLPHIKQKGSQVGREEMFLKEGSLVVIGARWVPGVFLTAAGGPRKIPAFEPPGFQGSSTVSYTHLTLPTILRV